MTGLLLAALLVPAQEKTEFKVEGTTREALVAAGPKAKETPSPLDFVFHGHGGTARSSARGLHLHQLWQEAVVVYAQGLPTKGFYDPEGKRSGWQKSIGDADDRDLKFFDAALAEMKRRYKIDERRIYATGHSNGGAFTYILWEARPKVFAAVAPIAAGGRNLEKLTPTPAMHVAGEKDRIVPFAGQSRAIERIRKANGCAATGKAWADGCTLYPSEKGAPVVAFIHPGGHEIPAKAPELIVRFFREHALAATPKTAAVPAAAH